MEWAQYGIYIFRWGVLAIPGALFFSLVQAVVPGVYAPMLVSQVALGAVVYFIDKRIFRGSGRGGP